MNIELIMQLLIGGVSQGAVYALIAVGFAMVFSVLKFSNFAHGGMMSACAYAGYFFQRAFDPAPPIYVTIIVTSIFGMGLTLLIDFLAYRRIRKNNSPKIYYFLASLTFAMIITDILNIFFSKNPVAYPAIFPSTTYMIGGLRFSTMDTMIMIVSIVLLTVLVLILNKTKIGLAIRAVAINPETSRLMGINSSIVIAAIFIIAGFLAGVSGVFLGAKYSVYPEVGTSMVFKGFVASVIGGLGSLSGAIGAAVLLGVLEVIVTYTIGGLVTPVITFAVMLIFLIVRPQGISGKFAKEKV